MGRLIKQADSNFNLTVNGKTYTLDELKKLDKDCNLISENLEYIKGMDEAELTMNQKLSKLSLNLMNKVKDDTFILKEPDVVEFSGILANEFRAPFDADGEIEKYLRNRSHNKAKNDAIGYFDYWYHSANGVIIAHNNADKLDELVAALKA